MLDTRLKKTILRRAKLNAPIDSGNLRHNAIKGKHWNNPNKFTVHYSSQDAHYIEFQEEGFRHYKTGKIVAKNRHFIMETYIELASMLKGYFTKGWDRPTARGFRKSELKTNPLRELRHNRSLDLYKAIREVNSNVNS